MHFAIMTVTNILQTTTRATLNCPGLKIRMRTRLIAARVRPQTKPTRISFHRTFATSLRSMSPTAMPRMIMVLAWLPAFPPVSISCGTNVTRIGISAKASSYFARIPPVTVALIMRIISQRIRCFAISKTPVFR